MQIRHLCCIFSDMMKLFEDECQKSGTIDMLPVKCIVTGMPGVGKTSFLNRIQNRLSHRTAVQATESVIPSTGFEGGLTVNITNEAFTSTQAAIGSDGGSYSLGSRYKH